MKITMTHFGLGEYYVPLDVESQTHYHTLTMYRSQDTNVIEMATEEEAIKLADFLKSLTISYDPMKDAYRINDTWFTEKHPVHCTATCNITWVGDHDVPWFGSLELFQETHFTRDPDGLGTFIYTDTIYPKLVKQIPI